MIIYTLIKTLNDGTTKKEVLTQSPAEFRNLMAALPENVTYVDIQEAPVLGSDDPYDDWDAIDDEPSDNTFYGMNKEELFDDDAWTDLGNRSE